jgi:hypothetical protein
VPDPSVDQSAHSKTTNRREFPRLDGEFTVRYGVCGSPGPQLPGFTRNVGIGGISFVVPHTDATVGDHLALEIRVPARETPLYFLGAVVRLVEDPDGLEIGLRFEYLGQSEDYKDLLDDFVQAHGGK